MEYTVLRSHTPSLRFFLSYLLTSPHSIRFTSWQVTRLVVAIQTAAPSAAGRRSHPVPSKLPTSFTATPNSDTRQLAQCAMLKAVYDAARGWPNKALTAESLLLPYEEIVQTARPAGEAMISCFRYLFPPLISLVVLLTSVLAS